MRKLWFGFLGAVMAMAASPVSAGGAFCTPQWTPENPDLSCASQIAIAPGNDTRINLLLLMFDRAEEDGAGLSYPDLGWEQFHGRNFLRWRFFAPAWYAGPDEGDDIWSGFDGRCQTLESGKVAFLAALRQIEGLDSDARTLLTSSRDRLEQFCKPRREAPSMAGDGGYFVNVGANGVSDRPFAFLVYLEGAAAFYDGNWDRARSYFRIASATNLDPWITETARYMVARTMLNQAIDGANDQWGWFSLAKADGPVAEQSEQAFRDYLKAYPRGRYAASASGLIRKALWLQRDWERLGGVYAGMLAEADPTARDTIRLINEVDDKFIMRDLQGSAEQPLLAATHLLMRMRSNQWFYDAEEQTAQLTKAELAASAPMFADDPELFAFLQASHAFYVDKDYRAVRKLLPDDAQQERYTPLTFSRQYLRGLALHALKDRNEEGFWRDLIKGAKGIWQRPAVELALARALEQKGELDDVFAQDSPITDRRMRRMLLGMSAGPSLLKQQARAESAPDGEQSFALFTALWRQLQHGQYQGFLSDYPLLARFEVDEGASSLWGMLEAAEAPLHIFKAGEVSREYPCPSLEQTVARLARNPADPQAKLCLGEFYRLNGFDGFGFGNRYRGESAGEVLGSRNYYPGDPKWRHDLYTEVMADRSASANDRAYALYRAIRCYAPSNSNSCGGTGVETSVRKRWFQRLKRDYPNSKWAGELKYYW